MFFVLSKTLAYLIMPLTIVCGCLIISFFIRNNKWKKRLLVGGIVLLLFFSNDFIANELMLAWEVPTRTFASMHPYRLGIVLTGTVIPHLKPDDRVYFQKGADRVVHTVQLYKLGLVQKILVSGGSSGLIDMEEKEADKFRDAMVVMGVPDSVIMVENQSRNTRESAVEVKKIYDSLGYRSEDCLLITSAFHMRRSLGCYKKEGMFPDAFTTDFYAHPRVYYFDAFLIPKIEALIIWHKLAKEWSGFIAYKMAGYI